MNIIIYIAMYIFKITNKFINSSLGMHKSTDKLEIVCVATVSY